MKLTTGILAISITMTAGATLKAAAQNPDAIDNARSVAKSLQQKQDNDSNAALNAAGVPASSNAPSAKPAPGAPAPAVKAAVIPGSTPGSTAGSKPAAAPAAQAASSASAASAKPASASHNQLQHVSVVQDGDAVRIELSASGSVTPRVSKLSSPARVLVELPGTIDATAKNHIAVASEGIKGIRIGMDGKTPPTTSVVVDLDKACAYEMTGSGDKLALVLHTQAGAAVATQTKSGAATASSPTSAKASAPTSAKTPTTTSAQAIKTPTPAAQPQTVAKAIMPPAKPQATAQPAASKTAPAASVAVASAGKTDAKTDAKKADPFKSGAAKSDSAKSDSTKSDSTKIAVAKVDATKPATPKPEVAKDAKSAAPAAADAQVADAKAADKAKPQDKKWAMSGKRDPFFSPVVQQAGGSGCSTGKKCLEIGNINLRGVVKSDTGFIAVVTNSLNKAYFLRENDPVFNGYVVKITGDSVVFQETVQDKLGKSFTREVVKRIFTPAV